MDLTKLTPPTPEEMAGASGVARRAARDWEGYCYRTGKRCGLIRRKLGQLFPEGVKDRVALDWGCGPGGTAMVLAGELALRMHAADVDQQAIAWLQRTAPEITCRVLVPGEALPYADDALDIVVGISVLTHIHYEHYDFYLAELARVLRAGGFALLTVLSHNFCRRHKAARIRRIDEERLNREGTIFAQYDDEVIDKMTFASRESWGLTILSRERVGEVFGRHFEVVSIDDGASQDLVTARARRKPPPAVRSIR